MTQGTSIQCDCIEITQPLGKFYIAALDCKDLIDISFSDIREYKQERLVETISGIQRPRSKKRIEELSRYVNTCDATFPTGVILAVKAEDAVFNKGHSRLTLRRGSDVAKVIDGQHRIEGLRAFKGEQFQINVTIFVEMTEEAQALVFSTINLKQTPVQGSLVYDLLEYSKSRSPQRTAHNVARVLNDLDGPFKERIMILGTATGLPSETLTQAAFVKPLLRLISINPEEDRDIIRRGRQIEVDDSEVRSKGLVFRKMFVQDAEDIKIAKVMTHYFTSVQRRWPEAWDLRQKGLVLNRTTGYRALMRFLPFALFSFGLDKVPPITWFEELFLAVKLGYQDFNPDNFKPGSSGEGALLRQLLASTKIPENIAWKGLS